MTSCQGQDFLETNLLGEIRHLVQTVWTLSQMPRGRDPSKPGRGIDASSPTNLHTESIGPSGCAR